MLTSIKSNYFRKVYLLYGVNIALEKKITVLTMANPNPKTEHLPGFPMVGDKPLGKKPVGIRVPEEDYERFMAIPKDIRSKLLRDFIRETGKKYEQKTA